MFAGLSNYLDDELDDSLCEELEKHMDSCEPCKVFLLSLEIDGGVSGINEKVSGPTASGRNRPV
jgi:hypothetical protein